jgi:hypothetical protein
MERSPRAHLQPTSKNCRALRTWLKKILKDKISAEETGAARMTAFWVEAAVPVCVLAGRSDALTTPKAPPCHGAHAKRTFQRQKFDGRSQQHKNFIGLTAVEAAPPSRTVTLAPGKDTREVALVNKAAELGNIRKLPAWVLQKFFGALDALLG